MQIKLTTTIEIPENVLEGVLTTAVEGGLTYWADGNGVKRREDFTVWQVTVWDREEPHVRFTLDADSMRVGVQRLADAINTGDVHRNSEIGGQFMHHLFANQEEDGLDMLDVVGADAIVQMACFDEIRFG